MSANSDFGPDYGKITVLEAPTNSSIQGPAQVANVFKSNPVISKDISLLGSGQSEVLHGNLLTLPLGDSFLYVEPLYVQSTSVSSSSFPTLQRVLVTFGDHTGYGATLADALNDIRLGRPAGSSIDVGQTTPAANNGKPSSTPTPTPPPSTPTAPSTSSTPAPPKSSQPPTTEAQILNQLATVRDELAHTTGDQPLRIAQLQQQEQNLIDRLLALRPTTPASSPSK
jgi:uncharacterized membrane protein (UPF0182 family)